MRRIALIAQWVQAFAAFARVEISQRPSRANEMLGYIRLIVQMAEKFRNPEWPTYDSLFRQKAAAEPQLSWAIKDPDLFTSHVLSLECLACSICSAGDYKASECALRVVRPAAEAKTGARRGPTASRDVCRLFNFAQNSCRFGTNCVYRHACDKCGKGHRALDCKTAAKTPQAAQGQRAASPRPQKD